MAARGHLSKLSMSTDKGNEERFLSYRQSVIEEKLLKCYADEILSIITNLVVENCTFHPSQRQHACLMMESDEILWLYFDTALERVCEATIAENFMTSLQDMKPKVNGLELLKYTCRDWRILFCTKQRQLLLKKKTLELL